MRVTIKITDDLGRTYEGAANLLLCGTAPAPKSRRPEPVVAKVDFSSSLPHFMRSHGKGMSGPQKFTLLLAHLSKGELNGGHTVQATEVERTWNRMKRILGMPYNAVYASRARDYGWVNSPKKGHFNLRQSWKEILRTGKVPV